MKLYGYITVASSVLPTLAFSQSRTIKSGGDFGGVVDVLIGYINQAVVVLMGLAFLVFFWGLARFIYKAGDTSAVQQGKELMIWGTIGLFVMGSLWGLIALLAGSFFS